MLRSRSPILWSVLALAAALTLHVAAAPVGKAPASPAAAPAGEEHAEFFETQVRPLLARSCYKCHGEGKQLGGLRLDSRAALLRGGNRGPAVVPGKPDASLLLQAVRAVDPAPRMPPASILKPAEIEALRRWIALGAPWPDYAAARPEATLWSIQPLKAPPVPQIRNPQSATRNPIDAFVLARLQRDGMAPAPPAPKRELARRLYYDLTGLPPSPEELRAFLADPAPDAYEKLVDRLLASPHYGERWARYWLDLVRYADSNGYERDAEKPLSWKYRDYVIRSLNADKPYDRFIREQLAGDELPERSEETLAATGLLRLGTWDDEPNDPLEYKHERLDDLVHTTSTAFLGLTVKCARCHDHKFDPISQQDYYAFAAAFYGGYLEPGDGKLLGGPPPERLPHPVLGFTDRGREAPELRLLKNGDPRQEGPAVPPAFLSAVGDLGHRFTPPPPDASTTGRRARLADWIADPRNPLTARVLVNRIWQGHFGEGLVRSPNNFGRTGSLPTHPELLDWLASWFVRGEERGERGEGGAPGLSPRPSPLSPLPYSLSTTAKPWSLKALHRLIVTSATYGMASVHPQEAEYAERDFANERLWRQNRRRLDADALRDGMLAVSGELNLAQGGRGFFPYVTGEALEGLSRKGAEWTPSPAPEQRRRTVYMFLKRALLMPLLTAFDFGDTTQPLGQRDVTTVPTQALALLNNRFIHERADGMAGRVMREAGPDPGRQVDRAWLLALGRSPEPQERARAAAHLQRLRAASPPAPAPADLVPRDGLRLWLRADRGVRADAEGKVLAWEDSSGAGNHAAPPAPDARPSLAARALGERPGVRFDGRGRYLTIPGKVLASGQFTLVAVMNDRTGEGGPREIFSNWNGGGGNSTTSLFLGLTGPAAVRLSDAFTPAGYVEEPSRHFILTAVGEKGGTAVWQDRRELARRAAPLPPRNLAGPYVVGQQGNIGGEYWNGDLLELLAYDRALTDAERTQVWDWVASRYGIAARPGPDRQALASLCRVLLNTNEFAYVD